MGNAIYQHDFFKVVAQCVFESGVHSKVDDNNRVSDYSAHGLKLVDTRCPLSKEDILEIIKEHPENKLW